ncbi:MAG: T9SS type A sorting domain-containing protein, partial [Thiobacillus sp.]|nr:T9SS type A sorting domain-containing protein [Thiobacillus sp.]
SRLAGAWPNPFNPSTTVSFDLERAGQARIEVFNTLGQAVAVLADENLPAGSHQRVFDASHLPSGMYLLQLELDGRPADHLKLMLLR